MSSYGAGFPCPSRQGVVERRSRRGKVFFGCDRYPECRFVLWNRPVAELCPDCGRPYLVERVGKRLGRRLACDAEGCGYSRSAEVEPATAGADS